MARRLIPLVFIAMAISIGCSHSKMPPLNSLKGRVTRSGTPVEHVIVTLTSEQESQGFSIKGTSDSSGDIEFSTLEAKTNLIRSGVPEGDYTVTVIVPMDDKQQGGAIFKLPKKFHVSAGENSLPPIDLDKYKKR